MCVRKPADVHLRECVYLHVHACIHVCLRVSTADDSVPAGQLLHVLILICAWAAAHHIPAPWCRVSKGGHYHPALTVSEPGEK